MFALHPAFPATSEPLGDLGLCHVRLQAQRASANDRVVLMEEIVLAGAAVRAVGVALGRSVEKLNVGQLGNLTPQLHIHVVGRRPDDAAWPGPVWGVGTAELYGARALAATMAAARGVFSL